MGACARRSTPVDSHLSLATTRLWGKFKTIVSLRDLVRLNHCVLTGLTHSAVNRTLLRVAGYCSGRDQVALAL